MKLPVSVILDEIMFFFLQQYRVAVTWQQLHPGADLNF
jgi:hypothetical protein